MKQTIHQMIMNLRYCLSVMFIVCLSACNNEPQPSEKESKNQLVIVIDKSNSVTFTTKLSNIESELKRSFQQTYGRALQDIQLARFTINGDTRVFPEPQRFNIACPNPQPESRSEVQAFENWQMEKGKWISDQIRHTLNLIEQPPYSNSTDVFSIFSGLEQVQRVDGPWDNIKVLIFSDMIHTMSGRNMKQGLTEANAFEKGKQECKSLISQGAIKKGSFENFEITIYTPDQMPASSIISAFWKGFFEEWGLSEEQWHFEY